MPEGPGEDEEQGPTTPLLEDGTREVESRRPKRSTLLTVCPFILGNEFCERLAFYGLSTNLIIYMTRELHINPADASIQLMLFEGTCYLTPVLGAWLADAHWGRYKTILVFSAVYFLGMLILAGSACLPGLTPRWDEHSRWYQIGVLNLALYVVAVGTGGIKPNVSAFGADQFDESNPQDRKEKQSFFNWFYFAINIGSLLAVTCIVYIQESISWAIGFGIPAAAMALAVVTFVSGSRLYTHVLPTESPITRVGRVLAAAWKGRAAARRRERDARARTGFTGPVNLPLGGGGGGSARGGPIPKSHSYQWLDVAVGEEGGAGAGGVPGFSREQVEEVRLVFRMLPIFFTTILFWTIYAQMGTFFVVQGSAMDRSLLGGRFVMPAASLALFDTLSIIALIPLYDRLLVPLLKRWRRAPTHLQRVGWGLFVCALAMLAAGLLEARRLRLFRQGRVLRGEALLAGGPLGARHPAIVDMSVFWQIPQYLLVGSSEVLASVGQLEFFYDQAPDVMRSCSMALQLLSVCIGSYLSGAFVALVSWGTEGWGPWGRRGWLPADLNHGRLDLFFYTLAGLMLLNLALFVSLSLNYQYKEVPHKKRKGGPPRPSAPAGIPPRRPGTTSREVPYSHAMGIPGGLPPSPDDAALYGRSVTYIPESPSIPAPFR